MTEGSSAATATNYVHIRSMRICGASTGDIVNEDSYTLVQKWATLELTNGQAWHKGLNVNESILRSRKIRRLFDQAQLARLQEVSLLRVPTQRSLVYVLNGSILIR